MSQIFIVGSINMDLVVSTEIVPSKGMTVSGYGFMTNPGGKGANQAVAAAKSGGDVKMVGCVGNAFGAELCSTLEGYGVDCRFVERHEDVSSGIAVIILSQGDNRIILDSGANGRVEETLIDRALATAQPGDYLIVQLEIPVESVAYALKEAKAKGMVTVLNPAPAKVLPEGTFGYVDYFVPNQTETEFYTGILPLSLQQADAVCGKFREMGIKNTIITMGSLGAYFHLEQKAFFSSSFPVEAVDTTAAGDTFVGTFVTRIARGDAPELAARYANKASSLTVMRSGAQQSIPYENEVILE